MSTSSEMFRKVIPTWNVVIPVERDSEEVDLPVWGHGVPRTVPSTLPAAKGLNTTRRCLIPVAGASGALSIQSGV